MLRPDRSAVLIRLDRVGPQSAFLSFLCFLLFISFSSRGQTPGAFIRSLTGQFLINDARSSGPSQAASQFGNNDLFVALAPNLLAVSAERIKQLLNRELANPAPWRSRIHLTLYQAPGPDSSARITCESFRDGWEYFLELPDLMNRRDYVRAITQTLLLEIANRNARSRSAELPTWLIEGLTEQLMASSEMRIVLQTPSKNVNGLMLLFAGTNGPMQNPLQPAREVLRSHSMLSFEDLSWPSDSLLREINGLARPTDSLEVFRRSSQLFVTQLLKLKAKEGRAATRYSVESRPDVVNTDGQAAMLTMLDALPNYYNWQFAFLNAFSAWFKRPLEVEKWWSLQLIHFTQREVTQNWPADESWEKLEEALRPAVQVRANTNEIPLRTDVPLQTIVREWDAPRQTQALKSELNELEVLRYRLAPQFVGIADGYHQTIKTYLGEQSKTKGIFHRKKTTRQRALEEVLRQLDALDAKRATLRPKDQPVAKAE